MHSFGENLYIGSIATRYLMSLTTATDSGDWRLSRFLLLFLPFSSLAGHELARHEAWNHMRLRTYEKVGIFTGV